MFPKSTDENLEIRELHPGKVINIVIAFASTIDIGSGEIIKSKFFPFKDKSIHFLLLSIFPHHLQ